MKKNLLIILLGIYNLAFAQGISKVSGKIIDDKLNCLFGVEITNLNNGAKSITNQYGEYEITASEKDTLEFRCIGLASEKIQIRNQTQKLNLIMINKRVNDLGAIWTDKQYRKANRQIEKQLKKLYKKAKKQNVWGNSNCTS